MKIDPAMLMLSAANPMLLPMAISRGYDADRLSRLASGTVRHEHHGSVEHSLKPGSGEELRGIEVSAQRAFAAYSYAYSAFSEFVEANAAAIAEMDAEIERQFEEIVANNQRKEVESKALKAKLLADTERKLQELLGKKHSTWLHFGCYDAEIAGLRKILDREKLLNAEDAWMGYLPHLDTVSARYRMQECKRSAQVERELKRLGDLRAVAAVAHGTQHMSRDEVLEIHRIEQPGWLENQGIYKRIQEHVASKTA